MYVKKKKKQCTRVRQTSFTTLRCRLIHGQVGHCLYDPLFCFFSFLVQLNSLIIIIIIIIIIVVVVVVVVVSIYNTCSVVHRNRPCEPFQSYLLFSGISQAGTLQSCL